MTRALVPSAYFSAARALPEMLVARTTASLKRARSTANIALRADGVRAKEPIPTNGASAYLPQTRPAHRRDPNRRIRVALYSHDTLGLGHLRRNLLIAQQLAGGTLQATILLITGAHEANFFSLPPGVDCLTLPRLQKSLDGSYAPAQLAISVQDLVRMRSEAILSALESFDPDLLVVDKVPTGAFGELLPTLNHFRDTGSTKCVLGIRDILDEPTVVQAEWLEAAGDQIVSDFYHEVWVYGDQRVYDPIHQYAWTPEVARRVQFTGYLDQSARSAETSFAPEHLSTQPQLPGPQNPLVVCTLGGGKDGLAIAQAFVEAAAGQALRGILLTGPFMSKEALASLRTLAAPHPNLAVVDFTPDADRLIRQADRVVAMAGYNTACAVLSYRKPSLLIPRVHPRQEQWIRASRFAELGLTSVLHPDALDAAQLREWLLSEPVSPVDAHHALDMGGLQQVERLVAQLVAIRPTSGLPCVPERL